MENKKETNVILFCEDAEKIEYFEKFFAGHKALMIKFSSCSVKTPTEEIFLRYAPNLIIMDFSSMDHETHENLMAKLERMSSMVPLVGIFDASQKEIAMYYVKRGVRDFLSVPLDNTEIMKVIDRFSKDNINPQQLKKLAKVYTFFSFKGGVGNTFTTINTAVAMAKKTKKKVLLWDMALQAGDIPFFLNFKEKYTLAEIVGNLDQIDQNFLEGVLTPHPSGVSILPAPVKLEELDALSSSVMEKILNLFMQHFDYIFIDGGYQLNDSLLPLMDYSSYLFITATLELISLRSAGRCLRLFEKLDYPVEKIKIVINRYDSKHELIKIDEARKILKFQLVHFTRNDYIIASKSINLGQPVSEVAPKSKLDLEFQEFAAKIDRNFSEEKKKVGFLDGLFHKKEKKEKSSKDAEKPVGEKPQEKDVVEQQEGADVTGQ